MDVATLISQAQQVAGRVDSAFQERTLRFLNEAVEKWALARPWNGLRKTVDVVCDGTRYLVFPDFVRSVRLLTDLTNKKYLDYIENWDRQATHEYLSASTGAVAWWREEGIVPVYSQPATPSYVTVAGASASDVFTVHLAGTGLDTAASGTAGEVFFQEELITVNGTTTATSTRIYKDILSVGKDRLTEGDLSIAVAGTQVGRVAANRWYTPYRRVELLRIPSAGTTLRAGVLCAPPQLHETGQVPHPSINPQYLIWYAAGVIHKAQNETDQAAVCFRQAAELLAQRDYQEQAFSDRDWTSAPDPNYWDYDAASAWQP